MSHRFDCTCVRCDPVAYAEYADSSTCPACRSGQHIQCENRWIVMLDGKYCDCDVCLQIEKDAEDERIEKEL